MTSFAIHTLESAPDASKPLLQAATKAYGFTPNLLAGMATAPALLEGYMALAGIYNKTALWSLAGIPLSFSRGMKARVSWNLTCPGSP